MIRFDNVGLRYGSGPEILRDVSFYVLPGSFHFLTGPSGAGKTTIVDLLLRLYDPDNGEIRVDGINLKEYMLSSWLDRVGFVSQDTFVFHESVKNNIAFGMDRYSDEEIIEAAKAANLHLGWAAVKVPPRNPGEEARVQIVKMPLVTDKDLEPFKK